VSLARPRTQPIIRAMTDNKSRKTCPICGKPTDERVKPFCSKRCADVDLHRWLSGSYAIPVTEDEEEDERRDDGGDALN
jgi:endogenous inhibitor of DNA gyrase (YacG/DUF329 family)